MGQTSVHPSVACPYQGTKTWILKPSGARRVRCHRTGHPTQICVSLAPGPAPKLHTDQHPVCDSVYDAESRVTCCESASGCRTDNRAHLPAFLCEADDCPRLSLVCTHLNAAGPASSATAVMAWHGCHEDQTTNKGDAPAGSASSAALADMLGAADRGGGSIQALVAGLSVGAWRECCWGAAAATGSATAGPASRAGWIRSWTSAGWGAAELRELATTVPPPSAPPLPASAAAAAGVLLTAVVASGVAGTAAEAAPLRGVAASAATGKVRRTVHSTEADGRVTGASSLCEG